MFTPAVPLPQPLPADVSLRLQDEDKTVDSALEVAAGGACARLLAPLEFGAPLSPALAAVMTEELEACRQLLEFDPDSKCEYSRSCSFRCRCCPLKVLFTCTIVPPIPPQGRC